jgi:all-trans-retinol dehydrogenase (NAD+)
MKIIAGRLALVTGGAQGIGRLIALKLAQRGCNVIVIDMKGDQAAEVADEINQMGVQAWSFQLDIADVYAIGLLKQQIATQIGRIDLLVNNAGVVFGGTFESVPLEKHLLTYQVNVMGLMALTHAFFGDLLAGHDTHLVNIASAAGYVGLPFGSTYASSKWGVIGFTDSIRLELRERGLNHVSVTMACPSYVNTGVFDGVRAPRLMPFLDADFIAEKIVEAIALDQAVVREPFMVKAIGFFKLLPLSWSDWAEQKLGITSSMLFWKAR